MLHLVYTKGLALKSGDSFRHMPNEVIYVLDSESLWIIVAQSPDGMITGMREIPMHGERVMAAMLFSTWSYASDRADKKSIGLTSSESNLQWKESQITSDTLADFLEYLNEFCDYLVLDAWCDGPGSGKVIPIDLLCQELINDEGKHD